ncbi:MAG: hypothetical protein ETSY2_30620, partial [Candidatus Entotheonella gemina]
MVTINSPISPCMAGVIAQPISLETGSLTHHSSKDAGGFLALWDQYKDGLLTHYCLPWMSGNRADAEDALSEASLRAWHAWSTREEDVNNTKGWFVRLVQNHCNNVRKAHTRRTRVVQCVEDITVIAGEQAAEDGVTIPEDVALRHELDQYIRRAIDTLPPRLQAPADCYFLQELACPDIATGAF